MDTGLVSLDEYIGLSIPDLESRDILWLNYCAARGLPGTEKSDYNLWLPKQSEWGGRAKFQICRHLYRFDPQANQEPTEFSYGNCLARFLCWHLLQVLQLQCGVKYHPDRKFKPDFCQPPDIFVHGIMDDDGKGGTCASMPVVYVSMCRFIGLPVYLVETRGHAFCRYDDPKGTMIHWTNPNLVLWIPPARFNIEGSGEGIAFYPDVHYMLWPEHWTKIDFEKGGYLGSQTAKESLAGFLIERGECFWELGNKIEALKAYYYALQLTPDNARYKWLAGKRAREFRQWEAGQREMERIDRELDVATRNAERRRLKWQGAVVEQQEIHRDPFAHGPSCKCFHCNQGREVALHPAGTPGHPPNCHCPICGPERAAAQPPFSVPNQLPQQVGRHILPGLFQPVSHIPSF